MLGEKEIKEIKEILESKESGNFFARMRQRKQKKELIKYLDELEAQNINLYKAKVRNNINSVKRDIKKVDIETINSTVSEESIDDM